MRDVNELLLSAADIVSERGLAKRVFEDSDGSVCCMAALMAAAGDPRYVRPSYPLVSGAVNKLSWHLQVQSSIIGWNDRPETTKEDVVLALKRAAHDG